MALFATFERLAWKVLSLVPKGYHRVDLVADCYFETSIKDAEGKRGTSKGYCQIRAVKSAKLIFKVSFLWQKQDQADPTGI